MILLDAHFGEVSAALDWRAPEFADESPDDDSELNPTPADVVGILGFDPREFEGPGDEGKVLKAGEREALPLAGSEVINVHGRRLRKAASLPPLQRGGPTVDRARRQFQAKLGEFLRDAAAKIARRVLLLGDDSESEKVAKRDPARRTLPVDVLRIDWDDLVPEATTALTTIAEAGGYQALAQLEIRDTDVISEVNSIAGKWAHERAAEMVGRKWVDGKLVDNPNAQWAISESTRDSLRGIVEDAFSRNTSMRTLASDIQDAGAFSESRAMMIAKTEALKSETQGNLLGWKTSGDCESYNWTLSADHPEDADCDCSEFAEGSPYLPEDLPDFPCHPNDECGITVARFKWENAADDED